MRLVGEGDRCESSCKDLMDFVIVWAGTDVSQTGEIYLKGDGRSKAEQELAIYTASAQAMQSHSVFLISLGLLISSRSMRQHEASKACADERQSEKRQAK